MNLFPIASWFKLTLDLQISNFMICPLRYVIWEGSLVIHACTQSDTQQVTLQIVRPQMYANKSFNLDQVQDTVSRERPYQLQITEILKQCQGDTPSLPKNTTEKNCAYWMENSPEPVL